jgi:hypothetical protein
MNQYIITEEELRAYEIGTAFERMEIAAKVRSRPYQNQREVLDELLKFIIGDGCYAGFTGTEKERILWKIKELRGER